MTKVIIQRCATATEANLYSHYLQRHGIDSEVLPKTDVRPFDPVNGVGGIAIAVRADQRHQAHGLIEAAKTV